MKRGTTLWMGTGLILALLACEAVGVPGEATAPADPEAGEIAFELAGPNEAALMVPVYLNGTGPYDFVLDTGATFTCVEEGLAEELALPDLAGPDAGGYGVGGAGRLRLVELDSLRLGAAAAEELTGCVLDLAHFQVPGMEVQGLVGLNFLRAFRVTLDFERNVMSLTRPEE